LKYIKTYNLIILWIILFETIQIVDIRVITLQEVMTEDNVPTVLMGLSKINDPRKSGFGGGTITSLLLQLAQTALRDVCGWN
jgi:regulator of protease activity HflC (stomatin/prohibitin superfamily)